MLRFSIAVTAVMLALTGGVAVWVMVFERPVTAEYLHPDELRAIGLKPQEFRRRRVPLPDGAAAYEYSAELEGRRIAVEGRVQVGGSRSAYDQALSREIAQSKGRPGPGVPELKLEAMGREQPDSFTVVRTDAAAGSVTVETWIVEGPACICSRVAERGIASREFAGRRDWCERQARNVAHVMLGAVREVHGTR